MEEKLHFHWFMFDHMPVIETFTHTNPNGTSYVPFRRGQPTVELSMWLEIARTDPDNKELIRRIYTDRTFVHLIPELKKIATEQMEAIIMRELEKVLTPNQCLGLPIHNDRFILNLFPLEYDQREADIQKTRNAYELGRTKAKTGNKLIRCLIDREY